METYDWCHDQSQISTTSRTTSCSKSCDWSPAMMTWRTRGRTPILGIQDHNLITNGGSSLNWYVAMCSSNSWYADIFVLNILYYRIRIACLLLHKPRRRACTWANLHSWVCRLSRWSNLSVIITNNKSSFIKNTIWLILDNIVVDSTTQLSAVCVISIISYRYISIFWKIHGVVEIQ